MTAHPRGPGYPSTSGFGGLTFLNEHHLPPSSRVQRHEPDDAEVITYVREGALAYEDSVGRSGIIHAGEFQRVTGRRDIRHSERNASRTHWLHAFQIGLRPAPDAPDASHEQHRFSTADRRGVFCLVASPDGRSGSLIVHQDVLVYSAILDVGQHRIYELPESRRAWVHVAAGAITLHDRLLTTGDGAGIEGEPAVSWTAQEETELLLFDLGN